MRKLNSFRAPPEKPQRSWGRILLVTVISLLGVGLLSYFLLRPPRRVDCITSEHTSCPNHFQAAFASLATTPRWRVQAIFPRLRDQAYQELPDLKEATLEFGLTGEVSIRTTPAHMLYPYVANNAQYQFLDTGQSTVLGEVPIPVVEFANLAESKTWSIEKHQQIGQLYEKLRHFSPRIRKILILTPTEIEVYPENYGKVLFTLENVEAQLATLQAFFRSTTMNHTYQVLDVRFTDVAVIKE